MLGRKASALAKCTEDCQATQIFDGAEGNAAKTLQDAPSESPVWDAVTRVLSRYPINCTTPLNEPAFSS